MAAIESEHRAGTCTYPTLWRAILEPMPEDPHGYWVSGHQCVSVRVVTNLGCKQYLCHAMGYAWMIRKYHGDGLTKTDKI